MLKLIRVAGVIMALSISGYVCTYFDFEIKSILLLKEELISRFWYKLVFYSHLAFGIIALTSGSFQFFPKLLVSKHRIHQKLGKIYFYAVLVSGITGLIMALYAYGGIISILGFLGLAIGWLFTSIMGINKIKTRNIKGHRRWMMRSYAFTFAAVTFRIWLGTLQGLGLDFETTYKIDSWLCWIGNLIVVEILISRPFPVDLTNFSATHH